MPYSLLVLAAALIGAALVFTWWRAPLLVQSRSAGRVARANSRARPCDGSG